MCRGFTCLRASFRTETRLSSFYVFSGKSTSTSSLMHLTQERAQVTVLRVQKVGVKVGSGVRNELQHTSSVLQIISQLRLYWEQVLWRHRIFNPGANSWWQRVCGLRGSFWMFFLGWFSTVRVSVFRVRNCCLVLIWASTTGKLQLNS